MNKSLLIGSVAVAVLIILAMMMWNSPSRLPSYGPDTEEPAASTLPPTEAGVDDITSEADVNATLDTNFDADLKQLDTELKGL